MAGRALMRDGRAIMRGGRALMATSSSSCCCGPAPCGCLAPCHTMGSGNVVLRGEGRYIQIDNTCGGGVPGTIVDTEIRGPGCCRNAPGRYYRRFEARCRNGHQCDGALAMFREVWINTDGNVATFRVRTITNSTNCCSHISTTDTTNPFVTSDWCFDATNWFGSGDPTNGPIVGTLYFDPIGIYSNSGWYATSATTIEAERRSSTWCSGGSAGYDYSTYIRASFSTDDCHDPKCKHACCLPGDRCRDDLSNSECLLLGGFPRPGLDCYSAACGNPDPRFGACCNVATGGCVLTTPQACVAPNVFRGLGSTCAARCDQPLGRCCIPSGGGYGCAENYTPLQCAAAGQGGGIWGGAGTNCTQTPCPPPTSGACCFGNGNCQETPNPLACVNAGGTFMGAGTLCVTTPCRRACCYGDGFCNVLTLNECNALNGVMQPEPGCVGQCLVGACCCGPLIGGERTCTIRRQNDCESTIGCFFFGHGVPCTPNPCVFGLAMGKMPYVPGTFSRGIVLPDGTPANTIGSIRSGGCSTCGKGQQRTPA